MKQQKPDWYTIGQIVGGFGLKGQLKVVPLTDFLERFHKGARLRLNDDWVTVEAVSEHKGHLLLKLSGINDLTTAESLQWAYLYGRADDRPELDKDEYLTSDLIGLRVETIDGEQLGKVDEVMRAPAQDVLVVGEILIPAVKQFVKRVDLKSQRIVVELIGGMRPGED